MNTLLLPRKGRARLKIDVEDWHNSLSGLLHLRVRAPSHLSRDKSLAVQPSAVAALVKKKMEKKQQKSPNTEEEFHATTSEHMRSVFTVTI